MLRYKDILLRSEARQREKGDAGSGCPPIGVTIPSDPGPRPHPAAKSATPSPPSQRSSFPSRSLPTLQASPPCSAKKIVTQPHNVLPASPQFTPRKLTARTPLMISPNTTVSSKARNGVASTATTSSTATTTTVTSTTVPSSSLVTPCKSFAAQVQSGPKPSPRITPRKLSCPRSPQPEESPPSRSGPSPFCTRDTTTPPNKPQLSASPSCRLFDDSDSPTVAPKPPPSSPPTSSASLDIKTIKSLRSLLWCDFPPGAFVMLDLDETLIQTRHSPALLLSSYGARLFKGYVQNHVQGFKNKNVQIQKLQEALKDKVLVEGAITTNTIKELQSSGCWVFGLTTRYSSMADATTEMLLKLGIDFTSVAPFPPTRVEDPMTGAVIANGVVYCNGFNKGFVLNRILENVVFGASLRVLRSKGAWNPPRSVARDDIQNLVLPPLLVLVDDVRANLESLLEVSVCKMLHVPVTGFLYTPPHLDEQSDFRPPAEDNAVQELSDVALKLLMFQMERLVLDGLVLSNARALALLKEEDSDTGKAEVVPLNP